MMVEKIYCDRSLYEEAVRVLASMVEHHPHFESVDGVWGVPRGGLLLARDLSHRLDLPFVNGMALKSDLHNARYLVVDDIIATGGTRMKYPASLFAALYRRPIDLGVYEHSTLAVTEIDNEWVHFWWEGNESGPESNVRRLLEYAGDDPDREGLLDTPARVVRAWEELFAGYAEDPAEVMRSFDNTEHPYDQIVLQKNIEFFSMCEHHMLPFFGHASVAYIPGKRIVGLSKLARLVEIYARRLQVQERMGEQIVNALMEHLQPVGVACRIVAQHLCIQMRGVSKHDSTTVTQSLKGVFIEDTARGVAARQELSHLFNGS